MAYTKLPMRVELADGRALTVEGDQRDMARWESQNLPENQWLTRVRFIAWSALTRAKQYAGTWEQFNTEDCIEASDVPDEEEEAEDGAERLDPGPKDQSAAS